MSSPMFAPVCDAKPSPLKGDWARLIPGEQPSVRGKRKRPQTIRVRELADDEITLIAVADPQTLLGNAFEMLIPAALQKDTTWRLLRCLAMDFALVGLNWLFLGALLVPLRSLFPRILIFSYDAGAPAALLGLALLNAALITLLAYSEGNYDRSTDLPLQTHSLGKSILWATALLILTYRLQRATWAMGTLFACVALLNFCSLWGWRWQVVRRRRCAVEKGRDVRSVLIVGAAAVGQRIASYFKGHPEAGRTVFGFLDDDRPLSDGVVGRSLDLARIARTGFVDEIILSPPHDRRVTAWLLGEARRLHLNVEIVPDLLGCEPVCDEVNRVADFPLICLHAESLPAAGLLFKRVMDVVCAGLGLIFLSPLFAVIAGLIKLDSSGPVLYRAVRAGRKARQFRCYKFRTMVADADALKNDLRQRNQRSGPFFKIANDPRITRVGRFLRRYSLDELPQLWNVLRGEMSLVGPRPHPLDDLAAYEIEHLARLDVTPGITGLWQVTARRDPSFEKGMDLDRQYIRTWRLASDFRIMLQTVQAIARGSGD